MFVWPMKPNWGKPVRQTFRFKTEVITSEDGKEQRIAERFEPRVELEFESLEKPSSFSSASTALFLHQNEKTVCPVWQDASRLQQNLSAGATFVNLAARPSWAVPGAYFVLHDWTVAEAVLVQSVSGNRVNFASATTRAWPSYASITHGMPGYVDDKVKQVLSLDRVGSFDMEFHAAPGEYPLIDEGSPSEMFNGLEVLTTKVDWGQRRRVENAVTRETIDYGFGRIKHFSPVAFPTIVREAKVQGRADKVREAAQFFLRHRGRQREFYAPSWQRDLEPVTGVTAAGASLRVKGPWAHQMLPGSTVHKAIALNTRSGPIYRKVQSVSLVGDDSLIIVADPWGDSHSLSNLLGASMLNVSRFASDALTVEWKTGDVGSVKLSVQSLEDLQPA